MFVKSMEVEIKADIKRYEIFTGTYYFERKVLAAIFFLNDLLETERIPSFSRVSSRKFWNVRVED